MWPSDLITRGLIIVVVLGGIWLYGFSVGINRGNVKTAQAETKALQIKEKASTQLAKSIEETKAKYEKANAINLATIDKLIASVRSRPNRKLPESGGSTCEGTTGAELAREDAEFLIRYAIDAQEQSNKLVQCYDENDLLRKAMKNPVAN